MDGWKTDWIGTVYYSSFVHSSAPYPYGCNDTHTYIYQVYMFAVALMTDSRMIHGPLLEESDAQEDDLSNHNRAYHA
jgi:hypothetical protein